MSNDNPFSEAQFRTVKYRPEFPDRFGSIQDARVIGHAPFDWYPVRHRTRLAAYAAHPDRFVHGAPRFQILPDAVWINPPPNSTRQDAPGPTIVTPDDPQHGAVVEAGLPFHDVLDRLHARAEALP